MESPLGPLRLVAADTGLREVSMTVPGRALPTPTGAHEHADAPVLRQARRELEEYFAAARRRFTVPLDPLGTAFQQAVWSALAQIEFGATRTYAEIARAIGRPTASRAVGAANGHNPLAILVPCHRVVGADGTLTGYAGGLERKRWLLAHEASQTRLL